MFYTWSGVPISYLQLLGQLLKQPERPKSWGERRQLQKPLQEQKIIDFEMGPSIKFVSPNKGLISKKKMGVNFFRVKNDQTRGGGPGGVWQKTILFHIFFEPFPQLIGFSFFPQKKNLFLRERPKKTQIEKYYIVQGKFPPTCLKSKSVYFCYQQLKTNWENILR